MDPAPEKANGHNCEAYVFSPTEMIRVEDDFINISQLAEPKTTDRASKPTEKMRESQEQDTERSRKKTAERGDGARSKL